MGVTLTVGEQEISLSVKAANVTLSTYIPGPKGDTGLPGSAYFELPTNFSIGGNRAVGTSAAFIVYADCSTSSPAIGISRAATTSGTNCEVQTGGKMVVPGAGWTPGGIIYASTNGTLTQTEPTSGFSQKLGVAHDAETIIIEISKPIILA